MNLNQSGRKALAAAVAREAELRAAFLEDDDYGEPWWCMHEHILTGAGGGRWCLCCHMSDAFTDLDTPFIDVVLARKLAHYRQAWIMPSLDEARILRPLLVEMGGWEPGDIDVLLGID